MASYSRLEVVLVRYPFTDLTGSKVRPAIVVSDAHTSQDLIVVALTSRTANLLAGEFVLAEWGQAGLNLKTALKRGIYTVEESLVQKGVWLLEAGDALRLDQSLRMWLALPQNETP